MFEAERLSLGGQVGTRTGNMPQPRIVEGKPTKMR